MRTVIEVIRQDHTVLLQAMQITQGIVHRYRERHIEPDKEADSILEFLSVFSDGLHHAREEQGVYPVIARQAPAYMDLLDRLIEEHQQEHTLLVQLRQLSRPRHTVAAYITLLEGYSHLINLHLQREDAELLPLLASGFTVEQQRETVQLFHDLQENVMPEAEWLRWMAYLQIVSSEYHAQW